MSFFSSGPKFTELDPTALKISNNLSDLANTATARTNLGVYSTAEVDSAISAAVVTDHGALTGLVDDDHTQYHNDTRGDARYYTQTQLDAGQLDTRYFTESEHIATSTGVLDAGKPVVLDAGGQVDASMINPADIDHDQLTNFVANEHIDWTQSGVGTIHASNYVDNDTTDHTLLSNIGVNTHAQIDTHIGDATVHFTQASIDHGSIAGLADDDHTQYHNDTRGDARYYTQTALDGGQLNSLYFTEAEHINTSTGVPDAGKPIVLDAAGLVASNMLNVSAIDHDALLNFVANEHIDWTQSGVGTIHASNYVDNDTTDHTLLSNIGTNTHAQIDTHIADSTLHFTEASIDHGSIAGLADDDHTQYVLADGTRAITGAITIDGANFAGPTTATTNSLVIGSSVSAMTGTANTNFGVLAGNAITSGFGCTYIGASAGKVMTTASRNTAVGTGAMQLGLTGEGNTSVGYTALFKVDGGNNNTSIGRESGLDLTTADDSVFIGFRAGWNVTTVDRNTMIGSLSGANVITGDNNTLLGYGNGLSSTSSRNIVVGSGAISSGIGNDNIILAGSSVTPTVTTPSNQLIVGAPGAPITEGYFGEGGVSPTPGNISFNATGANGTDVSASTFFDICGARGTGTGLGGHVRVRTAVAGTTGSALNSLSTIAEFTDDAKIGFFGVTPAAQPAAVSDPAGGTTIDAEARTAINAIIDALQALGLMA